MTNDERISNDQIGRMPRSNCASAWGFRASFVIRHSSFVILLAASLALGGEPPRLPRTNLLVYLGKNGELEPIKSESDWQKRRARIVAGMQEIMGPLPAAQRRCPLELKIETETDRGSYVSRFISYASEPGSRVPAYLLIPKGLIGSRRRERASGILALHPTEMKLGHRVVVEQLRDNYPPYAHELAERGYVVLAPAYPLMANYQPDLATLGYQSGTMKAVWDNIRGLDLLESLPFVRKGNFGAIGHSLGGHNSIYTAVFEPRIKVVVSSCGFDSFVHYMNGNIKGWCSDRYMPKLLQYQNRLADVPFDFYEVIGALAPRWVFINAPLGDSNFKSSSVDEVVSAARPVFDLYRASKRLTVEHPNCGHDFPEPMRQKAYRFFHDHLE